MPGGLDAEHLLPLVLLGIYVADSLLLLGPYDLLLESRRAQGPVALLPARSYRIARRAPLLLNLLTPWRLLARYRWDALQDADVAVELDKPQGPLRDRLAILATLLMFGLMVGIPTSLFVFGSTWIKIAMIAGCYGVVLTIAIGTVVGSRQLGMTKGKAVQHGLEMLLCPPLAINFPRKLGLSLSRALDPGVLDTASAARLREGIGQRIGDRMSHLDENSQESLRLKAILSAYLSPKAS